MYLAVMVVSECVIMRIVGSVSCFFCGLVLIVHPAPAASDPVPDAKPLVAQDSEPFVEGVDTPPAKPSLPAPAEETVEIPPEPLTECDVPGALIKLADPVAGKSGSDAACGIAEPVRLNGVVVGTAAAKFPSPVTVSCRFAKTLTKWLRDDVLPAAEEQFGSPVSVLASGPGYQCRRRNNLPDGKLSEHALGMAIDISHIELDDGSRISIEDDWGAETKKGRFLKEIHTSACERFTTVLGPDADSSHRSHFHLDIGCHGKACTYVICQ
ncbi:extensin family protein [Roseibium salinum]